MPARAFYVPKSFFNLSTVKNMRKPSKRQKNLKNGKQKQNTCIGCWFVPIGHPQHPEHTSLSPTSIPIPTPASDVRIWRSVRENDSEIQKHHYSFPTPSKPEYLSCLETSKRYQKCLWPISDLQNPPFCPGSRQNSFILASSIFHNDIVRTVLLVRPTKINDANVKWRHEWID